MTRSPVSTLACVLAAVALIGCTKTKTVIDIKADGSGTLKFTTQIEQPKLKQLLETAAAFGAPATDIDDLLDFGRTGRALEHIDGVRLVSQKALDVPDKDIRGTEMVVAFDSLEALAKSGIIQGLQVDLSKGEDGNYTLVMQFKPPGMEQFDLTSPDTQQMFEMQKMSLKPTIGGFEITDIVKLPTAPIETNGTKAETAEHSVMWSVTFDNADLSKLKRTVSFQGEGLDWKPFSVNPRQASSTLAQARKKVPSTPKAGTTELPTTAPELEALLKAEEARIATAQASVQAAKDAVAGAQKALAEANKALTDSTNELQAARAAAEKVKAALEKLKEPAGTDK